MATVSHRAPAAQPTDPSIDAPVDVTIRLDVKMVARIDATADRFTGLNRRLTTQGDVIRGALVFGLDVIDEKLKTYPQQPIPDTPEFRLFCAIFAKFDELDALPPRRPRKEGGP